MVSAKVQLANSAATNFKFDANVAEFVPSGDLNPGAKEFKFSRPMMQTLPVQAINMDSYSDDDESPRDVKLRNAKPGLNLEAQEFVPPCFNLEAKEFVPPAEKPMKPAAPLRAPPGLEKKLGLSVHAKEFVPPAPAPTWQCAVNLDDYTDDESEDEEPINIHEWRGLCSRLSSPYIWSEDKEEFMEEPPVSDSEAETAEPSPNSDTEGCSGCESP